MSARRTPLPMFAACWIPALLVSAVVAAAIWAPGPPTLRALQAIALLLLVPPLLARLLMARLPPGRHPLGSGPFLRWWTACQLQLLFSRVPLIEECLRLVPGCYQLWLRLWGARVHPTSVWCPGVHVADRGLVDVGRGAVIGGRATIGGHLFATDDDGPYVELGRAVVEDGAVVGMNAAVGPATRVCAGESLPATAALPPHREWRNGRRQPLGLEDLA